MTAPRRGVRLEAVLPMRCRGYEPPAPWAVSDSIAVLDERWQALREAPPQEAARSLGMDDAQSALEVVNGKNARPKAVWTGPCDIQLTYDPARLNGRGTPLWGTPPRRQCYLILRGSDTGQGTEPPAWVAQEIPLANAIGAHGEENVVPMRTPDGHANVDRNVWRVLRHLWGHPELGADDVFHYAACMAIGRDGREGARDEDGTEPEIPISKDPRVVGEAILAGRRIATQGDSCGRAKGSWVHRPEGERWGHHYYSGYRATLEFEGGAELASVPPAAWDLRAGGDRVVERWIERNGIGRPPRGKAGRKEKERGSMLADRLRELVGRALGQVERVAQCQALYAQACQGEGADGRVVERTARAL